MPDTDKNSPLNEGSLSFPYNKIPYNKYDRLPDSVINSSLNEESLRLLGDEERARLKAARERWEDALAQAEKANSTFSIIIIGQQNSGKSTLCNALVRDWSKRAFPVGDTRTTEEIQEYQDESGITYVDTPGFGSFYEEDKARAKKVWARARLLVFVHSARKGEMDADETETLKSLAAFIPDLKKRLFVACSKLGDAPNDVNSIKSAVEKQVRSLVNLAVPVEVIDSNWYLEAMIEGDEELKRSSRMDSLLQWIAENRNTPPFCAEIHNAAWRDYRKALDEVLTLLNSRKDDLSKRKKDYTDALTSLWAEHKDAIESAWQNCARYNLSFFARLIIILLKGDYDEDADRQRHENLQLAKENMNDTLSRVRYVLCGGEASSPFTDWKPSAEDFFFRDFQGEYQKINARVKELITEATAKAFDEEEWKLQRDLFLLDTLMLREEERQRQTPQTSMPKES